MNRKRMTKKERNAHIRHIRKMYRIKERKAKKENKMQGAFMNRVVICMLLAAFIYTVVIIVAFIKIGAEPSTLTENVFRFLSVEGGAMALIKSVKTVTKRKSEKQEEYVTEKEGDEI